MWWAPTRRMVLAAAVVLVSGVAACSSSTSSSSSSPGSSPTAVTAVTPTPSTGPIPTTCPAAATIGAALGRTLQTPIRLPGTNLPPGATGFACEYPGANAGAAVLIDLGGGVHDPSAVGKTEAAMTVAAKARSGTVTFANVPGVGTSAVLFEFHVPGASENGILAYNGSRYATITAVPAATRPQLEALATQLL